MNYLSKTTKLVTKLIRLTSENRIVWEPKDPPSSITRGTDDIFPLFFGAKYKDKYVAIYLQRYQSFYPDTESFYWSESIGFAVIDSVDRVLLESIEHSPALVDLMSTVREKASGLDELLDDLLDDENDAET